MGNKVKCVTGFLLGAILVVNFVHRGNTSRLTVRFPGNMVENDVVDIKGNSSKKFRPFLAKALDQNGQFVMGVYVQGARRRILLVPSQTRYGYRRFGKGKPFRIVLRLHNGKMEVRILDVQNSKYEVVEAKQILDRNVTSVTMKGSYSGGFIRKGRWNDYLGLPTDCGHRQRTRQIRNGLCKPVNPENNERIIGGTPSEAGAHPWQVSIRNLNTEENRFKHICGGVLIGNCWVLTAAHCFTQANYPEYYRVRVGDYYNGDDKHNRDFSAYEDSQEVPVNKISVHPSYWTTPSTKNDIALLRLQNVRSDGTCVRFGHFVQPVCLPRSGDQFSESDCVITGWGASEVLQDTDEYPSCLQQARVSLITNQECKRGKMGYSDIPYAGARILDTMFCAEGTQGTGGRMTDSCQGDSGGPLVCTEGASTNAITPAGSTLWGITSWGEGCGTHYGVYTKIFRFEDWITQPLLKDAKYDPFP